MDTLGLLGYFDFDGFLSGGDIATGYLLDAMCVSTFVAPKRSGKLTLTSKTVNSAFFLVAMRVVRRHVCDEILAVTGRRGEEAAVLGVASICAVQSLSAMSLSIGPFSVGLHSMKTP